MSEISTNNREFSLETSKENTLNFAPCTVWREQAFSSKIGNIEDLSPYDFVKSLMRFLLCEYNGTIINHESYKNNKYIFDNIDLDITQEEAKEFSEKFLSLNDYLLYETYSEKIGDDFDIDEFHKKSSANKKPYFEFPEDPMEKLQQAFILQRNRIKQTTEKLLGLNIPKNFKLTSDLINKQNDILKVVNKQKEMVEMFKAAGVTSKKTEYSSSLKGNNPNLKVQNILKDDAEYKAKINASIIHTPELLQSIHDYQKVMDNNIEFQLNKLIELQKVISDSNNAQLKASNEILQSQLSLAEDNIKSSAKLS